MYGIVQCLFSTSQYIVSIVHWANYRVCTAEYGIRESTRTLQTVSK